MTDYVNAGDDAKTANGLELTGGQRRRAQPPHAGRPC